MDLLNKTIEKVPASETVQFVASEISPYHFLAVAVVLSLFVMMAKFKEPRYFCLWGIHIALVLDFGFGISKTLYKYVDLYRTQGIDFSLESVSLHDLNVSILACFSLYAILTLLIVLIGSGILNKAGRYAISLTLPAMIAAIILGTSFLEANFPGIYAVSLINLACQIQLLIFISFGIDIANVKAEKFKRLIEYAEELESNMQMLGTAHTSISKCAEIAKDNSIENYKTLEQLALSAVNEFNRSKYFFDRFGQKIESAKLNGLMSIEQLFSNGFATDFTFEDAESVSEDAKILMNDFIIRYEKAKEVFSQADNKEKIAKLRRLHQEFTKNFDVYQKKVFPKPKAKTQNEIATDPGAASATIAKNISMPTLCDSRITECQDRILRLKGEADAQLATVEEDYAILQKLVFTFEPTIFTAFIAKHLEIEKIVEENNKLYNEIEKEIKKEIEYKKIYLLGSLDAEYKQRTQDIADISREFESLGLLVENKSNVNMPINSNTDAASLGSIEHPAVETASLEMDSTEAASLEITPIEATRPSNGTEEIRKFVSARREFNSWSSTFSSSYVLLKDIVNAFSLKYFQDNNERSAADFEYASDLYKTWTEDNQRWEQSSREACEKARNVFATGSTE